MSTGVRGVSCGGNRSVDGVLKAKSSTQQICWIWCIESKRQRNLISFRRRNFVDSIAAQKESERRSENDFFCLAADKKKEKRLQYQTLSFISFAVVLLALSIPSVVSRLVEHDVCRAWILIFTIVLRFKQTQMEPSDWNQKGLSRKVFFLSIKAALLSSF